MYLRPDEVARVLEKAGFTVDVVTNKTYGYRRGETHEHYGIPHGFSSRIALERYLNGLFGDEKSD